MEEFISQTVSVVTEWMSNFGFLSGFFLVVLESMIPVLPLGVFVALNVITFGSFFGFLISWVATITGCMKIKGKSRK